jgi:hypothetical protein
MLIPVRARSSRDSLAPNWWEIGPSCIKSR